jgi:hypothetical protein
MPTLVVDQDAEKPTASTPTNPILADASSGAGSEDGAGNEEGAHGEDSAEHKEDHPLMKEEGTIKVTVPPALWLVYLSVFIDVFGGLMGVPVLPQIVIRAQEQGNMRSKNGPKTLH